MSELKVPSSVRALIAKILWSKVTEIGGGKCYLQTNLDDIAAELEAALSLLSEEPEQARFERIALSMEREAALWPKTERAQQTARLLQSFATDIRSVLAASVERAEGRQEQEDTLAIIVRDLRALPTAWANTDVDDRNALTAKWRAALSRSLGAPPTPVCDCIASGNTEKPKQHGADRHAKNCAIYRV